MARRKSSASTSFSAPVHAVLSAFLGRWRLGARWTKAQGASMRDEHEATERRSLPMAWLVWALAWAMLLAPVLGQMHRAAHAASEGRPHLAAPQGLAGQAIHHTQQYSGLDERAAPDTGLFASAHASHLSWVHALFAGHGPADCQLLDQLHHALAGPPAALKLPQALPAAIAALPAALPPRAIPIAAHFDARAPPALLAQA